MIPSAEAPLSALAPDATPGRHGGIGVVRHVKKKELVMGRIVLAGFVVGLYASFVAPALAQITDQACVLRCLDHGRLDQYCEQICTKGVPPAATPKPSRAAPPANAPAAEESVPPMPAVPASPVVTTPSTPAPTAAAPPPAANQAPRQSAPPAPQPSVQAAPQPAANQAPPQPAAQASPQQTVRPPAPPASPARPVNQMCVLRCLDHGRLSQYCEQICVH